MSDAMLFLLAGTAGGATWAGITVTATWWFNRRFTSGGFASGGLVPETASASPRRLSSPAARAHHCEVCEGTGLYFRCYRYPGCGCPDGAVESRCTGKTMLCSCASGEALGETMTLDEWLATHPTQTHYAHNPLTGCVEPLPHGLEKAI